MHVRDVMTTPVFAVGQADSLKVVDEMMQWKHVRHVPVVDQAGHLVGLITHRDLLRACVSSLAEIPQREQDELLRGIPAREIMHKEVLTCSPEDNARDAGRMMLERKIGCLPVVENGKLTGILTEADFVRAFLEILE